MCTFALREAEKADVDEAEVYAISNKESEVFIESNDLKQAKSHKTDGLGIRVFSKNSLGFASTNLFDMDYIRNAVKSAIKLAKITPSDRFNSLPDKSTRINLLDGLHDKKASSFDTSDSAELAEDMLMAARSFDSRVSVDSGNFTSSLVTHALLNSKGIRRQETVSSFFWSIMGMAINSNGVSNFDYQSTGVHHIKDIDVISTGKSFAKSLVNTLDSKKIDSFKGEILLTPVAAAELLQDAIAHSINSYAVQKDASQFKDKIGESVSSDLVTVEDDATNVKGLAASSFDREGIAHKRNVIIERGVLRKFIYNTYTAKKAGTQTTGNAAGSANSPPTVSTTNFIIKPGKSKLESLISEIKKGIIINRFSGNVNPVNGDFSGVVKGGRYVKDGNITYATKEVMMAGNIFKALKDVTGISKEKRVLTDSILPYLRIDNISFTGG